EDGEVEARQSRREYFREGDEKRAAGGDEPHYVGVPVRPDGGQHATALVIRARHEQVQHAGAEVVAVHDHEHREHHRHDSKPEPGHDTPPCGSSECGPWAISRETRNRYSTPRTKYSPQKPISVKSAVPE